MSVLFTLTARLAVNQAGLQRNISIHTHIHEFALTPLKGWFKQSQIVKVVPKFVALTKKV